MPSETGLDSADSRFECCRMVADLQQKKKKKNTTELYDFVKRQLAQFRPDPNQADETKMTKQSELHQFRSIHKNGGVLPLREMLGVPCRFHRTEW